MVEGNWISIIENHLWQSTVLACVVWLLALALRRNQARVRYQLWLIASLKFLVPFSVLFAIGSHLRWTTATPISRPAVSAMVEQIARPFPQFRVATTVVPAISASGKNWTSAIPVFLLSVWICGFLVVLFSWARRWLKIRAAVRAASRLPIEAGLPVLSSRTTLEPGVFGIFRPVLLLPAGITDRLSPAHVRTILMHELCHVRRRDNLAATMHMMVEAIFWFHPLVWWIGSRLVDERERACDEEVLVLGSEPEVYAESILKACQFYLESPLACVSGITGSDLKSRIVRIMTQRFSENLTFCRKLLLAVVGVAAIAGPLLFGLANSQNGTDSQATGSGPLPSFEVASIKLNNSGDRRVRLATPPGRFTAENVSVKTLIEYAYNVRELQLAGGPSWIDSERYDIDAKSDLTPEEMRNRYPDDPPQALRLMVQSLLADRFKLALSRETKDAPIYVLSVAKGGPKFHQTALAPPNPTPNAQGAVAPNGPRRMLRTVRGQITMGDAPISSLAAALSGQVGRLVIDKTGLTGHYDLTLQWAPDESQSRMYGGEGGAPDGRPAGVAAPPPDANGPSIFTALQEQLGLKLESAKGPVETFAIAHIEQPSEN